MIDNLPSGLFLVCMAVASAGWLALLIFPRQTWANFWFAGVAIPLVLSLLYAYLLVTFWHRSPPGSLAQLRALAGVHEMFGNRGLLLTAWINILVADIMIGAWMARKAAQVRMPYVYLAPCLVLTFGFAGVGFIVFAVIVAAGNRWLNIAEVEGEPRGVGGARL